ncbi:membrane protein [Sphingobium quisquiliarum P25]|uniref:Membrane protein n=2 Tax=Sphingobium quisquiliarum TaxID=538379 RepID=T0GXT2_9SPHN|nr:membrane protein [Sphingobium quisquiliarum P25]EZP71645.1 Membrane protein [Sphingomonas paucimobilis]
MTEKKPDTEAQLIDPISAAPHFHRSESKIAIAGHPLHAMLVAFPIAMSVCTLGADIFYWWTGDAFWARAALWAIGMAFLMGLLAGLSGTVELLLVPGIRARSASWTHFIIATMLLALLGANWGYRLSGYEEAVLPLGILMSLLGAGFTGFTGWHGGKLVFDYQLGTSSSGN